VPGDYAVLAPIYDISGMSDYARRMTPHLMDYAQQIDWLGRRILVLGCGTGASIEYLSNYPYAITGIDNSPEMLNLAREKLNDPGLSIKWQQQDIRELEAQVTTVDLVLALNVFNEMNSLRDLETAFGGVNRALDKGKLFLFDMMTVQGLTEDGLAGNQLLHNDPQNLSVFTINDYDYERQMQSIQYLVFRQQGVLWERTEAKRILRAFPTQAVASLLQRAGFNMRAILTADLEVYEPSVSRAKRVVFVAEKQ
jgi:SAM-dependent methyltransferase